MRLLALVMVLLAMPTAVEFFAWIGVGPWGHPISCRVVQMGTASWSLMKMVPYSTSAADAIMFFMILHTTWRMPLMRGHSLGFHLDLVGLH